MDSRVASEVSITDLFDQFIEASTMRNVLSTFHRILNYADLSPCEYNVFFPKLKRAVMTTRVRKNWKAKALFSKIDKKAAHRCYSNTKVPTPLGTRPGVDHSNNSMNSQEQLDDNSSPSTRQYYSNNALRHHNCLIIGSGPAGLRAAIELQLLGASKVVVVEKRSRFSRNNVLHLWPFVIDDLKSLGAKKFYGKFCAGSIDHISIRQLQLILLKICLMIGCDFRDSCSYLYLCPTSVNLESRRVKNETKSDGDKAYGSCDSVKSIKSKCDYESDEVPQSANFVKVTDFMVNETKNQEQSDATNDLENRVPTDVRMSCDKSSDSDNLNLDALPVHPSSIAECQDQKEATSRGEDLHGCRAHFDSDSKLQEKELHSYEWDVIIGADGRRNTLSDFFPRKEFRGRLAIAITANFINRQTPHEAYVPEISGLSFIYNQDMFNALAYDTNIQLENICYYKDDTHYFVMTAKKKSLLERGVLINDYAVTQDLLADSNVNRQALLKYAKDAAFWTTGLEPLDFALNHYGLEDCAMFDFTSMYAATNACKALRTRRGGLTLLGLVGDSLLEPFWPTGSGCARGFLSSFDASWMCRQWAVNRCAIIDHHYPLSTSKLSNHSPNPINVSGKTVEPTTYDRMALSVMAERESIYRILAQTTSENLQQNYSLWTLNPHSRYPNLNRHLVSPAQIEHLLTDMDCKSHLTIAASKSKLMSSTERNRRVKSPNSASSARKSPKKLKSANSSPLTQHRNLRSSSRLRQDMKSRSRHEINLDDTYLEFEKSYNNLADTHRVNNQSLNFKRPGCDIYDDYFDPALSGTLPSSNNLLSLEARRARDIDDCLRQRRQKTQLNVVRDQLIDQFRGQNLNRDDDEGSVLGDKNLGSASNGGVALFNEMRRRRGLQSRGKENAKEVSSLTLLNSIRRCASFAERVKSFENKLSSASSRDESNPVTPKSPESVKNLPHFATLQELFVGNSTLKHDKPAKSGIPVMKLTKDDWNVKCWEKRLAAYKQKTTNNYIGSSKSLNLLVTNDNERKPEKQVAVFKDRIKEMAEKLETARNTNHKLYGDPNLEKYSDKTSRVKNTSDHLRSGWVNHLKRELTKGSEVKKQIINPIAPNRTIKKLFADDNDDDDGIDVNKHYDHLCINRPTNKYLSKKGGYSSHLVRTKYDSATSKVINRPAHITDNKQAYLTATTSRGSSASSTLSNYSTNTGESSNTDAGSTDKASNELCFRCNKSIESSCDKISISDYNLHLNCLTCASCSLTLRTSEVMHYVEKFKESNETSAKNFYCSICKPDIKDTDAALIQGLSERSAVRSREDFLNEKINYNELYKNILETPDALLQVNCFNKQKIASINVAPKVQAQISQDLQDTKSRTISPSPVHITLPLNLVSSQKTASNHPTHENIHKRERSETIDGCEQVTLALGRDDIQDDDERAGFTNSKQTKTMVDEEELERFHHPDKQAASTSKAEPDQSSSDGSKEDGSSDLSDEERSETQLAEDASSLNSSLDTGEFDANTDRNSTDDDFLTSEEFGPLSDCEEQDNNGETISLTDSDDASTNSRRNLRVT